MKKFGRFSEINKSKHQLNEWSKAINYFDDKKFLLGFQHLLNYIQNEKHPTVEYHITDDQIAFSISHNHLKIQGTFTENELSIWILLVNLKQKPLHLLRKFLTLNYTLNYSKFVIDQDQLLLKGYLTHVEYNPYLIYNLIQEIVIKGDYTINEILNDKASGGKLEGVEILINYETHINTELLNIKWNLLNDWINQTLKRANELIPKAISGGVSYLLLNLAYRIDYFLTPTGPLQITIEKINSDFIAIDNLSSEEKNKKMLETFLFIQNKLSNFPLYYLFSEAPYTFSFNSSSKTHNIINHLNKSIENYLWYQENNYPDIALECFEYGVLYNTFNYQIPYGLEELFELFLVILNAHRIQSLHYPYELYNPYNPKFLQKKKFLGIFGKNTYSHFNISKIQSLIQKINIDYKTIYPKFLFKFENLVFDNLLAFAISFTKELSQCDFNTYNTQS